MESLVHVIWITGAASVVFAWSRMGLFGGPSQDELDAVIAERDALQKKLDRGDIRVDEQKKKVAKLQAELEAAAAETKEVRRRAQEQRDECRKLQRQVELVEAKIQKTPAEQVQREALLKGLQEEVPGLKARIAKADAEIEEARQQIGSLERDKERLEKAVEAAKAEAGPAPAPPVEGASAPKLSPEGPPTGSEDAPPPPANDGLKVKVRELKEALRIKEGLLRKVRQQAEHNRRAYMITQLQMDLVHDEIYELKHGKPRRDTERSRQQRPPAEAVVEPESGSETPPAVELEPESVPEAPPTIEPPPMPESPLEDTK
jgi:peptidoglycan hydrolase CwlO-like protein